MPFVTETTPHTWTVEIIYNNKYAFVHWLSLDITENFDGVSASINTYVEAPELEYIFDLVTDITIFRDSVLRYRLRVVNTEHSYSRDAHTVKLSAVSYEYLLNRRILLNDLDATRDQHAWAKWLIDYTQARYALGITTTVANAGRNRSRKLRKGTTIFDAINDVAEMDGGFDWWIDQNRQLQCQTPRRVRTWDWEWAWGGQVAEVDRQSPTDNYASAVLVIGATSETKMPDGRVYPPPNPVYAKAPAFPLGLWEKTFSYSDIITTNSVTERAKWHTNDSYTLRPSYKIDLEPGTWDPSRMAIGDRFYLRAQQVQNDLRVFVRIEELSITLSADGSENITMSVRAETAEVPLPTVTEVLPPTAGTLLDEIVVPAVESSGRSLVAHYTTQAREFGSLLLGIQDRLKRVERGWETGPFSQPIIALRGGPSTVLPGQQYTLVFAEQTPSDPQEAMSLTDGGTRVTFNVEGWYEISSHTRWDGMEAAFASTEWLRWTAGVSVRVELGGTAVNPNATTGAIVTYTHLVRWFDAGQQISVRANHNDTTSATVTVNVTVSRR